MKKLLIVTAALLAFTQAHANGSVSIGIATPGVYLNYNQGYYGPYNGYRHVPRYVPQPYVVVPPPVYVNPTPSYNYYGWRERNPNFRPYQPTCTTYYTQFGPRTECN